VLRRVLDALAAQTLDCALWELILIDNASKPAVSAEHVQPFRAQARIVVEPVLGLTAARLRGIAEATGDVLVFVDDDNLLAPDYLAHAARLAAAEPQIGAWGGRIVPEFETAPAAWQQEFLPMLALRDLGLQPHDVPAPVTPEAPITSYNESTPLGAGMVVRKQAAALYAGAVAGSSQRGRLDRRGRNLSSGGDNDLVLTILRGGWDVAYRPELLLTHQIPAERLTDRYLGRLRRGIFRSWVHVRQLHGLPHPPPIPRWRLPFLRANAWVKWRAWRGGAAWVHWNGQCGDLEGRADLHA
jgi:glycosyltransferase involved in cell wall biosynthesis